MFSLKIGEEQKKVLAYFWAENRGILENLDRGFGILADRGSGR